MKIGVYFCNCGANISEKIDAEKVKEGLTKDNENIHFLTVDFLCSEDGKNLIEQDIKDNHIDRVVLSACSPRDHESNFMRVLSMAGINPYMMQMVNIREQVAWVTEDKDKATEKAFRHIRAALKRVALHDPLQKREVEICHDVLVIGAGPAGLKTALSIAESGRKAIVVEKTSVIGGMPVRFEELFPKLECGPCMMEPLLGEVLHGDNSDNIELLTISEVSDIVGSFGNFIAKIKKQPRYVDTNKCIGCGECVEVCPVSAKNPFNCGLSDRKAISFPFAGALPNAPSIDDTICLRFKGQDCNLCKEACPVEDAIIFDDKEDLIEKKAGAIVIAIGADVYDCRNIPNLAYGKIADIYTSVEFERIIASDGPTSGEIVTSDGNNPSSVAIVHCVGSLDKNHKDYCSGICCQNAFKFNHLIEKKLPGTKISHFYKEIVVPGKEEFSLYQHAKNSKDTTFIRYGDINDIEVRSLGDKKIIKYKDVNGQESSVSADIIILCPAVVPSKEATKLSNILDTGCDRFGFFEELHGRLDSAQSKIKGIYLAGTCQSPMDIQKAMNQGMAAAGYILSGLVEGKKLEISPVTAVIDETRCSGCRVCVLICPYKAISFDTDEEVSLINDILCQGCGTCVAACPAGAIKGNHFTNDEIFMEIEEVLK